MLFNFFILIITHFIAKELHYKDNVKLLSPTELVGFFKRTNQIKDIKFEEKSHPIGSWGGRLGELVCIINF